MPTNIAKINENSTALFPYGAANFVILPEEKHELYVPYLREPASAFGKKTVKLWTTKATTTKVTATKKSLWRMYAADKTRELFD